MVPDMFGILFVVFFFATLVGRHVRGGKATQSPYYPFRRWERDSLPSDWPYRRRQVGLCCLMFLGVVTYGVVRGVQYGAIHPATIVACFLAVHFLWIFVRIGRHAKKMQGVATGNAGGAEGRDDGAPGDR